MTSSTISHALERAEQAFQRKPGLALGDDAPARALLHPELHCQLLTPAGDSLQTGMPAVLGGDGQGMSPGWLLRAGLASCLCTAVAMRAARCGITLRRLEVLVTSRSDARGLLGDGPVAPVGMALELQIAADGIDAAVLREIVAFADAHSPVSDTVRRALDLPLRVVVVGD